MKIFLMSMKIKKMKKTIGIILILLFNGCVAFGQTGVITGISDTGYITLNGGESFISKLPYKRWDALYENTQYDTIRCLMIVCDTMHYTNYTPSLNRDNYFDKSGVVVWVGGYEVIEKPKPFPLSTYAGNSNIYLTTSGHIAWLDADKKELQKNIIVWQSK
jgi:hypothetical protein